MAFASVYTENSNYFIHALANAHSVNMCPCPHMHQCEQALRCFTCGNFALVILPLSLSHFYMNVFESETTSIWVIHGNI